MWAACLQLCQSMWGWGAFPITTGTWGWGDSPSSSAIIAGLSFFPAFWVVWRVGCVLQTTGAVCIPTLEVSTILEPPGPAEALSQSEISGSMLSPLKKGKGFGKEI